MKNKEQMLRKRKLLLALPLLILPFISLVFWAMGGGKQSNAKIKDSEGLNMQLPDAKLKDEKDFDKLSFYNQAEKDSIKNEAALRNDPNYKDSGMNVLQMIHHPESNAVTSPFGNNGLDANEQKIYKKINELNQQIYNPKIETPVRSNESYEFSRQVDKLQSMMQMMNEKKENDPEMEQIGGMLDKILDVQHPDRVEIKDRSVKDKGRVFAVYARDRNESISLLQSPHKPDTIRHNHFYEMNNGMAGDIDKEPAIEAVVHQTQTIVSGSAIKLRLVNDIYVNGILIPAGNFIYGTASLENERLALLIQSIRYRNYLFPVSLAVYDLDGIAGIHIPGSVSREVVKQSSEQSLQNIEVTSLDPSLAAKAANTGIQAAKSLLSKSVKEIKVTLKAGYKVLLNNK